MGSFKILPLFIFQLLTQACFCETHRHMFTANTNFDNPNRWTDAEHGYPCAGDKIEFSPDQVISVFVQTDASISEMILPMNGEFIFGDGVVWGVSEELSVCSDIGHSHVVHFSSEPDNWYKTSNWEARTADGNLLGRQDLLDIEQVPCLYDDAKFPETNSFTSDISSDALLTSLSVDGKDFDTSRFGEYRTGIGKYNFVGNGKITISANGCQDATGCLCRLKTNLEQTFKEICANIECFAPPCKNAILPLGTCCQKCGATLTFNYTQSYTELKMREHLQTVSADSKYAGAHIALSKVVSEMLRPASTYAETDTSVFPGNLANEETAIQILITDEETDAKSGTIAKALAEKLYDELSSPDNSFSISMIQIQTSGPGTSSSMSAGAIAGIVIGSVLGCVLLLVLVLLIIRSAPLVGKKYRMTFELSDADYNGQREFPTVTEVGPGPEFESTDDNPNMPKSSKYGSGVERIGWGPRSPMESGFRNPAYDGENL